MNKDYENIGTLQDKVIEECGEVLLAIGKANRFGLENFHPDRPYSSNRIELIHELKDVINAATKYLAQIETL